MSSLDPSIQEFMKNWDRMTIYPVTSKKYMKKFIKIAIKKLLYENDQKDYIVACQRTINLPKLISNYIEQRNIHCEKSEINHFHAASEKWQFSYPSIKFDNFEIDFTSQLTISKIIPIYEIFHSFEIKHTHSDIVWPTLDGGQTDPFSREQCNFFATVINELSKMKYYQTVYKSSMDVIILPYSFRKAHPDIKDRYVTLGGLFYMNSLGFK